MSFKKPSPMSLLTVTVFAALALWVGGAFGADATLTWTAPTQNTDNSAIPATGAGSLVSSRVEWGSCIGSAFGTKAGEATVPAPAVTYTVTDLAPATWCFQVFARNTYGRESLPSLAVSKIVLPPTPKPPVITVATLAYDLTSRGNIGRLVGRVPLDTPCMGDVVRKWADGSMFYEVPREAVTLTRQPRSTIIVAKCS